MKFLVTIIAVFCITATTAQDDGWVAGRNPRSGRAVTEVATSTSVCASSANGVTYCSTTPGCSGAGTFQCYNGAALAVKPCADPTPYCSGGACVASSPNGCAATNFVCPGEGYFPKYDDCYTYYYCYFDPAVGDFVAEAKICNTGYPFNPAGPQGRKCKQFGACVKATCTAGKSAEWKAMNYAGFTTNQIALYCVSAKPVRVDSCPAGLSIELTNTASKKCSVKCLKDYQTAIYEADNQYYYVCRGGSPYLDKCEFGQIFDAESLTCVIAPATTTVAATTTAAGATTTAAGATTTAAGATTTAAGATTTAAGATTTAAGATTTAAGATTTAAGATTTAAGATTTADVTAST